MVSAYPLRKMLKHTFKKFDGEGVARLRKGGSVSSVCCLKRSRRSSVYHHLRDVARRERKGRRASLSWPNSVVSDPFIAKLEKLMPLHEFWLIAGMCVIKYHIQCVNQIY